MVSGRCGSCSARWPCPLARDGKTVHNARANVRIRIGIVEIRSFIPDTPLTPNHSSVSDKKSIALWFSALKVFERRKRGSRRVDGASILCDLLSCGLAIGRPARHKQIYQAALKARENHLPMIWIKRASAVAFIVIGALILIGKF